MRASKVHTHKVSTHKTNTAAPGTPQSLARAWRCVIRIILIELSSRYFCVLVCPLICVWSADDKYMLACVWCRPTVMCHSGPKCKDHLVLIFITQRSLHFHPEWYHRYSTRSSKLRQEAIKKARSIFFFYRFCWFLLTNRQAHRLT